MEHRPHSLWRFHEVLPILNTEHIVSLGEGDTPLIQSQALAASLGLKSLYHQGRAPGADRQLQGPPGDRRHRARCKEMGVDEIVVASTGNVAIAYARLRRARRHQAVGFLPQPDARRKDARSGPVRRRGDQGHRHVRSDQGNGRAFAKRQGLFLDRGIKVGRRHRGHEDDGLRNRRAVGPCVQRRAALARPGLVHSGRQRRYGANRRRQGFQGDDTILAWWTRCRSWRMSSRRAARRWSRRSSTASASPRPSKTRRPSSPRWRPAIPAAPTNCSTTMSRKTAARS